MKVINQPHWNRKYKVKEDIKKYIEWNKIKALPLTSDNMITFQWRDMKFIDSFKFMSTSLGEITSKLPAGKMALAEKLYHKLGIDDDKKIKVFSEKNIFPYLWFDSYDKLNATSLPDAKHFKSDKDYKDAKEAWDILGREIFRDYHDYYLKADVVLLTTCFQSFRETIYEKYRCDPAYYLGLPGLSWDLALKESDFVIKLLEKQEDYLRFHENLQGGIVQVNQRYAKKKDNTLIHYFDVNGLYAYIMERKKLPYELVDSKMYNLPSEGLEEFTEKRIRDLAKCTNDGQIKNLKDKTRNNENIIKNNQKKIDDLKVLNKDELKNINESLKKSNDKLNKDIEFIESGNTYCYFFIVDAKFMNDFKKYSGVRDLPFFPKKISVDADMKSDMQKKQSEKYELKDMQQEKLITTLKKTKNYLVHIDMLLLAMDNGYKLSGIHGYYKFKEDYIFSKYIKDNNDGKKEARIIGNELGAKVEKDKSNIIYGKTIQNVLKNREFEVVPFSGWDKHSRINEIQSIKNLFRVSENLIVVEKERSKIALNMPIYIGKAVLDLSKAHMYEFFHNCFKKQYNNGRLLYMDTDSFILEIPDSEAGFEKFVLNNKDRFDFKGFDNKKYPYHNELQRIKSDSKDAVIKEHPRFDIHIQKLNTLINSRYVSKYSNTLMNDGINNDEIEKIRNKIKDEILNEYPILKKINDEMNMLITIKYEETIGSGEPGKFKSETNWFSIQELVALRPKQYSLIDERGKGMLKAKGTSKDAVKYEDKTCKEDEDIKKKRISHNDMVEQVMNDVKQVNVKMSSIRSKMINGEKALCLEYVYKRALINYEDKRYLLDSVYSLPYGDPLIKDIKSGAISRADVVKKLCTNDDYKYVLNADVYDELSDIKVDKEANVGCYTLEDINYDIMMYKDTERSINVNAFYRETVSKDGKTYRSLVTYDQRGSLLGNHDTKLDAIAGINANHTSRQYHDGCILVAHDKNDVKEFFSYSRVTFERIMKYRIDRQLYDNDSGFHEVIVGNEHLVKPYFDYDYKLDTEESKRNDVPLDQILKAIRNNIMTLFMDKDRMCVLPEPQFIVFDSSIPTKSSYHILINNYRIKDRTMLRKFVIDGRENLIKDQKEILPEGLDHQVYQTVQNLRIATFTKTNVKNYKKLVVYNNQVYRPGDEINIRDLFVTGTEYDNLESFPVIYSPYLDENKTHVANVRLDHNYEVERLQVSLKYGFKYDSDSYNRKMTKLYQEYKKKNEAIENGTEVYGDSNCRDHGEYEDYSGMDSSCYLCCH